MALPEFGIGLLQLEKLGRDVFVDANPRLDRGRFEWFGQDIAHAAVENRRDFGAGVGVDHCQDLAGGGQSRVAVDLLDQILGEPIGQPPINDGEVGGEFAQIEIFKLGMIDGHHRVAPYLEHGVEEGSYVFVVRDDEALQQWSRPGAWGGPAHRALITAPLEVLPRQFSRLS